MALVELGETVAERISVTSMGKIMREIRFLYDDGTEEIIKLSRNAYEQARRDALNRRMNMYAVIKEMVDELRESKRISNC